MPRHKSRPGEKCIGVGISLKEAEVDRIDSLCADGQRSHLLRTWILDALVKEEQRRNNASPAYLFLGGEQ
jgi:hypothetical protein